MMKQSQSTEEEGEIVTKKQPIGCEPKPKRPRIEGHEPRLLEWQEVDHEFYDQQQFQYLPEAEANDNDEEGYKK